MFLISANALAGTAVFSSDADTAKLTLGEGDADTGAAVTYSGETIHIIADDRSGWGASSAVTVDHIGTPMLKGLGTVEITLSDISEITEWWHKYYPRVFVQDSEGNEIGIIVFRILPIGGGTPNTAIDIQVYDGAWNWQATFGDWWLPVVGTTHMRLVFSDTEITVDVDDGSGGWITSDIAKLDLTNLPGIGDATVPGAEYKGRIEVCVDGAANMNLGFDEIKIDGPQVPNVNVGSTSVNEITVNPASWIVEGMRVELTAPAGGTDYTWEKDGIPVLNDPSRVTGAQERMLVLDPVEAGDSGSYVCWYDDGSTKALVSTPPFALVVNPSGAVPVSGIAGLALLTGILITTGATAYRKRK